MTFTLFTRRTLAPALLGLAALAAPAASQDFCEIDNLVVMQMESIPAAGDWTEQTSEAGFTGTSYYNWTGPNFFNLPGNGVMTVTFEIFDPGIYQMRLHNLHTNPDVTLENDCWIRMDGAAWEKCYSSLVGWNWSSRIDPVSGSDYKAFYNLTAGIHTFEISGRSHNYRIDRIHFYKEGIVNPTALYHDETVCPEFWIDLGDGLAGTGGQEPVLTGEGDLTDGALTTLNLTNALPAADAYLVVGLSELGVFFKQGTMVPNFDLLVGPFPVGAGGDLPFAFNWFSGIPTGFEMYYQYWVQDPGGPAGFAASNGLKSVTP